jgi:hypothetical protein
VSRLPNENTHAIESGSSGEVEEEGGDNSASPIFPIHKSCPAW